MLVGLLVAIQNSDLVNFRPGLQLQTGLLHLTANSFNKTVTYFWNFI